MKIHVTQEDIQQGKRRSCYFCPVAISLRRHKKRREWYVGWNYLDPDNRIKTPKSVQTFITTFDQGIPVKPFAFILK